MAWLETDRHGRLRIAFKYYDGQVAHPQGLVTPDEVFDGATRPASGSPLGNAATACRSYRIDRCPETSNTIRTISMIPTIPIPPAGP
jgi:hypothetical protein